MPHGALITPQYAKMIYRIFMISGKDAAWKVHHDIYHFEKTSFYSILSREGEVEPAEHLRDRKWTEGQIECVVKFLEENPAATLNEILNFAQNNHLPKICIGTLHNYLETELITRKQLCLHPQERNSQRVKIMRRDQAEFLLHNQNYTFVFIDEFGFNLSTQRRMGRSKKGQKAILPTPLQRGSNVSVCLAVEKVHGYIYHSVQTRPFKGDDFEEFLEVLADVVESMNMINVVFILDNAPAHMPQDVQDICALYNYNYMFDPPYSPMFNVVEEIINDIKNRIKTLFATTKRSEILAIASAPRGQKTLKRTKLLMDTLNESMDVITSELVIAHYDHYLKILADALEFKDL